MALVDDILLYGNKAQSKMLEYTGIIEEVLLKGNSDDITLEKFNELFDFQVCLFDKYNEWTDADKAYWIAFMTERHELNEIPYTAFDDFVLPAVVPSDTEDGNYVTHGELSDAVTDLENADDALDARVTALEEFDYSTLIPPSLIADVADNKAGLIVANENIDELQDAVLDLEDGLADHIGDDSKHFVAGEKAKLATAVQPATLTAALETKADVDHTHDISEIDGLQDSLNDLQTQISELPTPQDGNDGITPVISAGTVEEGEEFDVEITGPAEAPVFNFTLVKGDKGDPFEFDAIDTLANRSTYDAEEAGFVFLASDTGNYYIKNESDWGDPIPFQGWNGWSPRLANFVVSDSKVVQEFLGWQGGTGTPPELPYPIGVDPETVRFFIGSAGLVTDPALAVNIMGPTGPDGEKGDTFQVNAEGTDRSIYDAQEKGFAFLNTVNGKVSFKLTDTSADWSSEYQWTGIGTPGDDGEPGDDGADGEDGAPGESAYDVAVANGFVGTEEEWLESLIGADGEDGIDGDDGAPGVGVPAGGTTGQILSKVSDDDHDTQWIDAPDGGGGGAPAREVFNFNSSLFTEDELLFRGVITDLEGYASDELSAIAFEVRLASSGSWTAAADLAAIETWIGSNVSGDSTSGTKFWIRALATYSGSGRAQYVLTYTA